MDDENIGKRFGKLVAYERLSNYKNNRTYYKCRCDCGSEHIVSMSNLKTGHTRTCGKCSRVSNRRIDRVGERYGRLIITEMLYDYCKNVYPLRFDFFLPKRNICIECQGQQHYHPVEFFGGETRFASVVEHDRIKREYCNSHGISLIYFPYTFTEQEINEQINSILNPCNDYAISSN